MNTSPLRWLFALTLLSACAAGGSEPTPFEAATPVGDAATVESASTPAAAPTLSPDEPPPFGVAAEFKTDFSKHSVPYDEILSGGPPKGGIGVDRGIPAIADPAFVSVSIADGWLKPVEPVILVQVGDEAKAYPIQILMWHEIVNDVVGGAPLAVTFCPLCNTAIAFERTVNGQVMDFGTTGRLRYSNLIMYDQQTETWWQQATGEAIVGELLGAQLVFQPASIIAWSDFKAAYPDGKVLSNDTGFSRRYGVNPYSGYDDINNAPFLYDGPTTPDILPPIARVLTIDLNDEAAAYPYDVLQQVNVVNDAVGGTEVVVLWAAGTASALDAGSLAGGRDVGAAVAYARKLDGETLTFTFDGSKIVDNETGSEWDVSGRAVAGSLAGKQLTPVVAVNHFWFSWAAFKPETRIYQP